MLPRGIESLGKSFLGLVECVLRYDILASASNASSSFPPSDPRACSKVRRTRLFCRPESLSRRARYQAVTPGRQPPPTCCSTVHHAIHYFLSIFLPAVDMMYRALPAEKKGASPRPKTVFHNAGEGRKNRLRRLNELDGWGQWGQRGSWRLVYLVCVRASCSHGLQNQPALFALGKHNGRKYSETPAIIWLSHLIAVALESDRSGEEHGYRIDFLDFIGAGVRWVGLSAGPIAPRNKGWTTSIILRTQPIILA